MTGASKIIVLSLFSCLLMVGFSALAQQKPQGSKLFPEIFDDNWTPPTRPESKPIEPAAKPVTPTPAFVTPKIPNEVPPVKPPTVTPPTVRVPPPNLLDIPAAEQQANSRKLMREIFAAQLADKSPVGRQKLVQTLSAEAEKVRDNAVDRYVLLTAVLQAAREASNLPAVATAAEQLAIEYKVDALAVKADLAGKITFKADAPALTLENVKVGMALINQLLEAEDFTNATRIAQAMHAAGATDLDTRAAIIQRTKDIAAHKGMYDRAALAMARLKTSPTDPEALGVMGSYLCFVKNDWAAGLPLLAKGTASPLNAAATADLQAGENGPELAGDAWWAASDRETNASWQLVMRIRAAGWYRKSLDNAILSGLKRTQIQKRIESLEAAQASSQMGKPGVLRPLTGTAKVIELERKMFSNRDYVWTTKNIPSELMGRHFVFSTIDSVAAECIESGTIYAVTHAAEPNRFKDSQERYLIEKGFQKVKEYKYGTDAGHVFALLKKEMRSGEKISVGKYAVLIFK